LSLDKNIQTTIGTPNNANSNAAVPEATKTKSERVAC
jgi:hypothetical protein